jgi:DNA-binding NarL/FixJ family response regulator
LIRLGIVDDHPTFRVGLKRLFEDEHGLDVAWDLGTLSEMTSAMASDPVDVVLLDLNLGPNEDSLAATRKLVDKQDGVVVIVISASFDLESVAAARQAGAHGYLPKDLPVSEMVAAVTSLAQNKTPNGAFVDFVSGRSARAEARHGLTKRELDVVAELRRGRTNREIAGRLGVSVTTVNKHVQQVLKKLYVSNRSQAVARLHAESLGGFSKPLTPPNESRRRSPANPASRK